MGAWNVGGRRTHPDSAHSLTAPLHPPPLYHGCTILDAWLHSTPHHHGCTLLLTQVYFFADFFTTKIFAQKPLVVTSPCPSCSALLTVYFGDLLSVQTDGIIPKAAGPPMPQIEATCGSCKAVLIADRDNMIISTLPKNA